MPRRTEGVRSLVEEVLRTFRKPYSEDVTDQVCNAIERNPEWLATYHSLVKELTRDVVNNWIGEYVKSEVGGRRIRQVRASGRLLTSYSKLGF